MQGLKPSNAISAHLPGPYEQVGVLRDWLVGQRLRRLDPRQEDRSRPLDVVVEYQVAAAVLEVQPVGVVVSQVLELQKEAQRSW